MKNRCKRLTKNKEFKTVSTETLLPLKKRAFSYNSSENDTETESISDYGLKSPTKTMNTDSDQRKMKVFKAASADLDLQEGIDYFNNFLKSLQAVH